MRYTQCMPTPEERMFQEAVSALENGELARSRDLLTRLLKLNQQNAQYWLYMSAVVETQKERIYCLKEVLRLEPDNPTAQVGLSMIGQTPPNPNLIIPMKVQKTNWQKKVQEQKLPSLITGNIWPKLLLYGGIGIGLVILVLGGIWLSTRVIATPETTEARSRRLTVAALQPTQGATQTSAATPMPTTLYAGLSATYTPTAIYIKTPHPNIEAFGVGMRAYYSSDWEKMIANMRQVQTMEPSAADISYFIGEGYRKLNRYSEALAAYNDALKTNPQFAPAYLGRARILLIKSGQEKDARTDIQEAIRLDEKFAEAYLVMADIDLRMGEGQNALEQAEKAASILTQSPMVSWYQGRAYLALDDYEHALQAADQAIAWDVGYLDAYRLQGEAYRKMGRWEESIQPLTIFAAYQEDPQVLAWLGEAYARTGDPVKAESYFGQALAIDEKLSDVYLLRGNLYLEQGEIELSISDFDNAFLYDKKSFEAKLGLGRAYLLNDLPGDAYAALNMAYTLMDTNEQKARLYYWRAQAIEAVGERNGQTYTNTTLNDWRALLALPDDVMPEEWKTIAQEHINKLLGIKTSLTPVVAQSTQTIGLTSSPSPVATQTLPLLTKTPTPN